MDYELTHRAQLPYPGSRMDEELEVKKTVQSSPKEQAQRVAEQRKQDEAEAVRRNVTIDYIRNERQWKKLIKQSEDSGKKFTAEELESFKKKIEKGEPPTIAGGAIDVAFDGFDAEKYKENKILYGLAQELKDLDKNDPDLEKKYKEISQRVIRLMGSLGVPEPEGNKFIQDMNQEIQKLRAERKETGGDEDGVEGDGIFSQFEVYRYEGTGLEPLARAIAELGRQKKIDEGALGRIVSQAQGLLGQQGVTQELLDSFNREVQSKVAETNAARQPQATAGSRSERRLDDQPKSIQEICRWIIEKEGDEWGPGGVNELIDKWEQGAKFNKANFVKWVRERMLHFQDLDPNNPSVNLLGSIGIETQFRTVGLITMINNKKQYFKDEGSTDEKGRSVVYSELADDIINEVYLFNTSRNHDAGYRFEMWSDEGLPKFIQNIHQKSDFTTGAQMKKIFSFSADYGKEGDTKVGDTIRTIYEAYYFISDYDELQRVLGKDSVFFTRKGFEDAWRLSHNKPNNEPIPEDYKGLFDSMFDASGQPIKKEFLKFVNLFNDTGKKQTEISLVREALRLAGEQKHGLESGLNSTGAERTVKRKNLEYAEMWANTMVRWTGAAARNDTGAIGYDAFTKPQRFQQYRLRQSKASRGAPHGNEYDLPVIKSLALDFFNGIFVERPIGEDNKELTPFEVLRMLDDVDEKKKNGELSEEQLKLEKDKVLDLLKFKQYTQLDYANNHLARSYQIFHSMMGANELNLDQIVTHDRFRGLVFDRGKFEEQVKEGFIKPIRYAFSTYSNIDYSKEVRVWVGEKDGIPQYETKTMAEAMFGPVTLQGFYKKERGPDGKPVVDKEKLREKRSSLYKNVCRSIIASHLQAHRKYNSGYAYMNEGQVTKFIEALETIRETELEDVGENTQLSRGEMFFSHEDIAWIRKYSATENWRLILTDVVKDAGMGVMGGMFKGLKDFFDDVAKG